MTGDSSETTFSYIIGIEDCDLCKIGISARPIRRLDQLSHASPFPLFLVAVFALPTREWAAKIERAFHLVMKERRVSGEWFHLSYEKATACMHSNIVACLRYHVEFSEEEIAKILPLVGVPAQCAHTLQ